MDTSGFLKCIDQFYALIVEVRIGIGLEYESERLNLLISQSPLYHGETGFELGAAFYINSALPSLWERGTKGGEGQVTGKKRLS